MTKRQLIDEITMRNPTAKTDFLARFEEADLGAYLDHLIVARRPRLSTGGNRYAKYFVSAERMSAQTEQPACSGPVRGFLEDRPTAPPTLVPADPIKEAARTEDLPLEQSEPAKVTQPALFAPRAANVNERAHDEPIPIPDSTWRKESEIPSSDAGMLSASEEFEADAPIQAAPDAGGTPATHAEAVHALVCSYQVEVAPIVVARDSQPQEQTPDVLEETNGLPSPYGQEFHGEDVAPDDEVAPPADADEIGREEPAADEPVADDPAADEPAEEDVPVEETLEEPAEESLQTEEPVDDEEPVEKKAKPARKKRQPVAVGAERETNNNQDSDSWLF